MTGTSTGTATSRARVRHGIAAVVLALGAVVLASQPASAAATTLVVPQGSAFSVLGHSCGGIQEKVYATGFDATSGYPTGDAFLSTRCGGSGRGGGGGITTYSAWVTATWDFTAALISYQKLSSAPAVNPTFSAFDSNGNEVYNSAGSAYLVLAPGFVPAPRATGISPTVGPASGGTTVAIRGTAFTGTQRVSFGTSDAASFTVISDTSITAVSPAAAGGTVDVTVTNAGGTSATSAADSFTFVAAPVVTGIDPNTGPVQGGTAVSVTGANFTSANAVYFGDNATWFIVNSDTSITAYAPASDAPDTVDVVVASIGGTSARSSADQYGYGGPPSGS